MHPRDQGEGYYWVSYDSRYWEVVQVIEDHLATWGPHTPVPEGPKELATLTWHGGDGHTRPLRYFYGECEHRWVYLGKSPDDDPRLRSRQGWTAEQWQEAYESYALG